MKAKFLVGLVSSALTAAAALAQPLPLAGDIERVQANVPTFDPAIFGPGPNVDVWHIVATNPNPNGRGIDGDATSLAPVFEGPWLNAFLVFEDFTFSTDASLPTLGPNDVAESFFVIPDADGIIAQNVTDEFGLLSAEYTLPGAVALVEAGGTSIVAVVSTAAGEFTRETLLPGLSGRAVINSQFVDIVFPIPEPTTLLTVAVGVATCFVARGRRERAA